ncbi:MAG: Fur family transcriptional regulator, partial [Oscillospiraceae bacterium]
HLSVDDITALLEQEGSHVGRATVYRCLDRLVEQGALRRFAAGEGASACYQFVPDDGCIDHHHLKCTGCNALLHVECGLLDSLAAHLLSDHGFVLDTTKTVLYGLCADCAHQSHQ